MTTSEGAARRSTPPPAPPTPDHAAQLRAAMTQTQLVFEGDRGAEQALDYLRVVLNADPATAAWLQGGQLHDQKQTQAYTDDGAVPAEPTVTKLTIDIDASGIDAAMVKLDALKASAAETRAALLHEPGAVPAAEFDRLMTAAQAATDLAEQQIERAERATSATMDLARRCQRQEEQIASLIAAVGTLAARP